MWTDRGRGAVSLIGPRSAVGRPSVVSKMRPAQKSTPRNIEKRAHLSRSTFKHRALRSPIMTIHDIRLRQPLTTTASALQRRKTLNIEASKPTLGSEIGLEPRETAQTRNIRYPGGHGCRSYASIPRGLRCEPWSGRAEDIGMNGDNQLHLGVICRQSVEEADQSHLGCM